MNLFIIVTIAYGTLYRIEAADVYDGVGNILDQRHGNRGVFNSGYNGNLGRNYGQNPWSIPNITPNRFTLPTRPDNGINFGVNGNYGTNSLWNRPINPRPVPSIVTGRDDDIDPEVAKQFPELVDILNRLKELNKLKEESKLDNGDNKTDNGNNNKPNENINHNNGTTNVPNNNDHENKPTNNGNAIVIAGGNVYFQAQPVVPDDERIKVNETIYYVKA